MRTKLASALGLAMLSVAFSFSTSFACPEASQTTALAVESTLSESGTNVTASAEAAPEGQVGEVVAPASVVRNIEAPSGDAAAPSIAFVDAIRVEITETVTVVVPGQKSEDDDGAAISGSGVAAIEPSVTEVVPQTTDPESEAKATAAAQTGAAEAQIEVAEPAATVAAVEPPFTDVTAPSPDISVDAVPVEISVTVTVAVPGQKSEDIDEVEITGSEPEHPIAAPNLNRDKATADDNGG